MRGPTSGISRGVAVPDCSWTLLGIYFATGGSCGSTAMSNDARRGAAGFRRSVLRRWRRAPVRGIPPMLIGDRSVSPPCIAVRQRQDLFSKALSTTSTILFSRGSRRGPPAPVVVGAHSSGSFSAASASTFAFATRARDIRTRRHRHTAVAEPFCERSTGRPQSIRLVLQPASVRVISCRQPLDEPSIRRNRLFRAHTIDRRNRSCRSRAIVHALAAPSRTRAEHVIRSDTQRRARDGHRHPVQL